MILRYGSIIFLAVSHKTRNQQNHLAPPKTKEEYTKRPTNCQKCQTYPNPPKTNQNYSETPKTSQHHSQIVKTNQSHSHQSQKFWITLFLREEKVRKITKIHEVIGCS